MKVQKIIITVENELSGEQIERVAIVKAFQIDRSDRWLLEDMKVLKPFESDEYTEEKT